MVDLDPVGGCACRAAAEGLSVTLMERLIPTHPSYVHMLNVQYRMNSKIMQWASEALYQSLLTAAPSVANHLLRDLQVRNVCYLLGVLLSLCAMVELGAFTLLAWVRFGSQVLAAKLVFSNCYWDTQQDPCNKLPTFRSLKGDSRPG